MPYRAFCRSCKCDFSGVDLFDKHRVGVHAYTHAQGLALNPPVEDGRRCLDASEMETRGWRVNERGRWCDPGAAERLRAAHRPQTHVREAILTGWA